MGNSDVQTLLDLIRLLRANVLEEMATCEESRFRENQGRIQAYDKLEQMITRPPLRM